MFKGFLAQQVMGIEPTCSAWKADILPLNYTCIFSLHRGDRIRTCGFLVPNQALYQTEPHPETYHSPST